MILIKSKQFYQQKLQEILFWKGSLRIKQEAMNQKRPRFSYLQKALNDKENEVQASVCRTQQNRTYSDPEESYKFGNGERYKTGYHFKLKEALKENSRNIFYLRKVYNEKNLTKIQDQSEDHTQKHIPYAKHPFKNKNAEQSQGESN